MATCPRCGTPAPDEGRFCPSCGGYLTAATSGPDDGDTQRIPVQGRHAPRPRGIPAIDDEGVPQPPEGDVPQPEGDTFDAARLPMSAYPVEAPTPEGWEDAPDPGWYQDPSGSEPPAPGQGFPPAGPAPPFPQQPPFGQAPPPYGGQGSGGYYPYDDSPEKPPNAGRAAILAVIGAVAVVALVFGGVLLIGSHRHDAVDAGSTTSASRRSASASASSASASASSANTPQQQAAKVNQLLDSAVRGKSMLTLAYGQAVSCKISPADAASRFQEAAQNRRALVTSARRLDTSKLPNGARIRQLLITMYGTSAKADDAFAGWARAGDAAGDSCLKGNAKRTKGNALSVKASRQKRTFTNVWNPVARTYQEPQRTETSL